MQEQTQETEAPETPTAVVITSSVPIAQENKHVTGIPDPAQEAENQ